MHPMLPARGGIMENPGALAVLAVAWWILQLDAGGSSPEPAAATLQPPQAWLEHTMAAMSLMPIWVMQAAPELLPT